MQKESIKTFFAAAILHPVWAKICPKTNLQVKAFKSETTSFICFFSKDSKSLKHLDIRFLEVGATRCLKGSSKVNRHTDTHTDRHTYGLIDLQKALAHRADTLERKGREREQDVEVIYFFFFQRERGSVNNHGRLIVSFFKFTSNPPNSSN